MADDTARRVQIEYERAKAQAKANAAARGQEPNRTTFGGAAKTALSSLREIPEGLAKSGSALTQWEEQKTLDLMRYFDADPETLKSTEQFFKERLGGWTPEQVESGSNEIVNTVLPQAAEAPVQEWTQHQPQNPTEQDIAGIVPFLMGLLTKNPEGMSGARALLSKLVTRVAVPATAVHTAGDIAHEIAPEYENAVRFLVGAIATPGAWKSAGARAAARSVSTNPTALGELRQALLRDYGDTPAGMQRAQQALQEMGVAEGATLMDIGPNLKQAGQQVFAKPGAGRESIYEKLKAREDTAGQRGESLIRENVGPAVDEGSVLDALQARKEAGARAQEAAHPAQTAPIDLSPVVTKIDTLLGTEKSPKIRAALNKVRQMLYVGKTDPSQPDVLETASETVLSARQAISEMLYEADGTPKVGLGPKTKQRLDDLYADINKQIDPANPALRAADAEIAQAAKEGTAFKTGKEDVLSSDSATAIAPQQFARNWDALSPGERTTLRQGLTARIDAMRGVSANDRAALKRIIVGEGKWNHQKIAQVIGQEAADNLVSGLEREKTFQQTEHDVLYNSKTAQTQTIDKPPAVVDMAKTAVERSAAGGVLAGPQGAAVGAITAPITSGLTKLGDWVTGGRRAELGRLLASGGKDPQALFDAIEAVKNAPGGRNKMLLGALLARKAQLDQQGGP